MPVGVHQKRDVHLRHLRWHRRNAGELELAQQAAVAGELAFALVDVQDDGRLVVGRGGVSSGRAGRDRAIAVDELVHDAAERLDAEAQWHHVQQQRVFAAAGENVSLDRGSCRHDFVRVQFRVRRAAEERAHSLAHQRHPRRAADQDDFIHFAGATPASFAAERHFCKLRSTSGPISARIRHTRTCGDT